MTDRTVAARMRKYRALKALVAALDRADQQGVDLSVVLKDRGFYRNGLGPDCEDRADRNADRRYGVSPQ